MNDLGLLFFNTNGDCLNFSYDTAADKYSTTLNFNANSSDIFQTMGLYLFQKVDSINFDSIDNDTNLQKFQLFNENRFTYNGNAYFTQSVTDIQVVNNNNTFYSKWIYGLNFESMYPLGSSVVFNNNIFDFSTNIAYTVVGSRKGAIMVISNTDNVTFNNLYGGLTVSNVTISGLNSIGVYDYKKGEIDQLSTWNESKFYNLLYDNKKLTILNGKTSSVVTIKDNSIIDRNYYKYSINITSYTQSSDLTVYLTLKTNLPTVYTGSLTLDSVTSRIYFNTGVPNILKPNVNFVINDSVLNTNILTVDNISSFIGNVSSTYYPLSSQVIWNNLIYQCVQSYTQSLTASTTPDDSSYWTSSVTYLPSKYSLVDEILLNTSIHLTTNVLVYTQSYTNSNATTMALFAKNNASNFSAFNVNLSYNDGELSSDLIYSSKYVIVDYQVGTNSITNTENIIERVIATNEILPTYVDTNICSNKSYSVVISYIDNFGIKFLINGSVYHAETEYVYTGLNVDQVKTIDRTLRNFIADNFFTLNSIGIGISLRSTNYVDFDFYKDTIEFTTEYPNIPFQMTLQLGSLAQYYVKHSVISFNDLGSYLNININNIDYGIKVTSTSSVFIPDIPTALSNWVSNNYSVLYGYGIYVSSIRNNLYFNVMEPTTKLKYSIRTNKLPVFGAEQYIQTNYISGNLGSFITGNEIIISSTSSQNFESSGFSTGMITSVNNTIYPYNNQEYNIIHVESNRLGLSYQGPFWGTNGSSCNVSSLGGFGFSSLSYVVYPCPTASSGGQFGVYDFTSAFAIQFEVTNTYQTNTTVLSNTNMVDLLYVDEYSMLYALGSNLSVVDASTLELITVIPLVGSTQSIKIVYNGYNKLLYSLTNNLLVIIDPNTNEVVSNISITGPTDISVNQFNGDIYVVENSAAVKIFKYNSFVTYDFSITITSAQKIVHNFVDGYMYVTGDKVYVINTVTRSIMSSYVVPSLNNNYIYTEPIYGSVYIWGNNLYKITNGVTSSIPINNVGFNDLIYDNFTGDIFLSQSLGTELTRFDSNGVIGYSSIIDYGSIVINQFDGDLYMVTPAGVIVIIDPLNGTVKYSISSGYASNKIIYNPLRNSSIILGTVGAIYELRVVVNSIVLQTSTSSSPEYTSDGFYGTLANEYVPKNNIWLKTRQYLRKPRYNYSGGTKMQFVWKFEDDQVPDIFMYDLSGNYLTTGTLYSYIGPKPLPNPVLNFTPNADLTKISDSSAQQTVFDEIINTLEYYDDANDISVLPTPMELFLGYNSSDEGYQTSNLKMYVRENISFTVSYSPILYNDVTFNDYGTYGTVVLNRNSIQNFVIDSDNNNRGLKKGQLLRIGVSDITNNTNKYISMNNGKIFKINQVYNYQLVLDYIPDNYGITASLFNESSIIVDYPIAGNTTYLNLFFQVVDREVVSIQIYGQTEIEDIRYKTELNNVGHNIDPSDAYIFKTYDVDEQGVDWTFLNKKRKEMLIVKHEIFPYVGSYKAIINAINYFGYNDLVLYEYYRNININSPNFFKLFKVEIPDIFSNANSGISGWTVNDFLAGTMPNSNYEVTNLFNLTYLITDKKGNNVLLYSLQEVIIKLHGLKNWLEKNVVPITHKILDITGRTDFVGVNTIRHKSFGLSSFKVTENMTPIDFNINEAYLMPINSGSTIYNVVIDFVASKSGVLPSNFTLNIRTYKTYKEWNPFTMYNMGDQVIYYGIIYESTIDNNYIIDPRTYDNLPIWSADTDYYDGQIINYNRYAYEYLGTQSSFLQFGTASVPTPAQTTSWLNVSNWVQVDMVPVQNITEYRYINGVTYSNVTNDYLFYTASVIPDYVTPSPLFNFSVDSNIDPFIVVEVNSENGYGLSYTSRKNYEIRGLNDLFAGVRSIESIGPFVPIVPIVTPLS